tara:strand:- start:125 stop:661 length:537 start_codon:yes stop_codon:yes gene_type:complete
MALIIKKLNNYDKNIIVITGHMGSGKSLIGKKLAKYLNWQHFDSDKEIEKSEEKKISEIFKDNGEKYFRKQEEIIIKSLLKKKYSVISLGGGSITIKDIRKLIRNKSISIFLKVDIDVLIKRLKKTKNRPLLLNTDVRKKIIKLDKDRHKFYNSSDIIIENKKYYRDTVKEIIKILTN